MGAQQMKNDEWQAGSDEFAVHGSSLITRHSSFVMVAGKEMQVPLEKAYARDTGSSGVENPVNSIRPYAAESENRNTESGTNPFEVADSQRSAVADLGCRAEDRPQ